MAPPPGKPLTAAEKNIIPLLDRFQCRDCKKWKAKENFAKKETKDYQWKKASNPRLDGVSANLRCRDCAGAQVHELQCEGQCGEWKPLDDFSKAQRTRGEKWCKECVLWKEAAEHGVVTAAAPNTDLAPDEYNGAPQEVIQSGGSSWDPEMGNESGGDDYEDNYFSTPYHALSSLTLTDNESTTVSGSIAPSDGARSGFAAPNVRSAYTAAATSSGYLPPHLRNDGSNGASLPDYTPPHLRGVGSGTKPKPSEAAMSSVSSASNPYATTNGSTIGGGSTIDGGSIIGGGSIIAGSTIGGSTVAWSAVDARRRAAPLINPPLPASDGQRAPPALNGHRAPPAPVFVPQIQASQPQTPTTQERATGNWARATGSRRAPPQFPAPRVVQARNVYDSDESQDEM